jgi:trehalose 6-phosphate phosphatase
MARHIALFLDFDGTLTPLTPDPAEAVLDPAVGATLKALAGCRGVDIAIISGRALDDLQECVGIDGIVYAGNHGLEISGREIEFVEPLALARRHLLLRISEELARRLSSIPSAAIEFKELSLSVHYRRVRPDRLAEIESVVHEIVADSESLFKLNPGNMIWDIVPRVGWDKGSAAVWIRQHLNGGSGPVIYIGDDRTDEDAFRRFRGEVSIHVGSANGTAARFFVADPAGVHEFLEWLRSNRCA